MPQRAARERGAHTGAGGLTGARSVSGSLAARGIAWIVGEGVATTQGARFRVRESTTGPAFPVGVYDGAAGVAMVLADWTRATRDPIARDMLRAVAEGLAASGTRRFVDASLYFGEAGRISALLRAAAVLRDPVFRDAALDLAPGLLRATWPLPDLLYGPAGTGIAALQLHRATGDRGWLRGARRAAEALGAMAAPVPGGIAWRMRPDALSGSGHAASGADEGTVDTGLAHGAGGVLLFLEQAAPLIGGRRLTALRAGAWAWLRATAVGRRGTVAWPKAVGDDRRRYHWCHGTAGLVQILTLGGRGRRRGGRSAAGSPASFLASGAGRHAWNAVAPGVRSGRGESACHCHGLAGTLDALCALDATGVAWVRRPIARLVAHFALLAGPGDGPAAFGLTDAGLETGVAGVVRALMLAAGMPAPAPYLVDGVPDLSALRAPRRRAAAGAGRSGDGAARGSSSRGSARAPAAALPIVAAPLRGDDRERLVHRTTADHPRLARPARRLLADERLRPLHEAWALLAEGLAALAAEHRAWVGPSALAPAQHVAFLRPVAGILLHGTPSPAVQAHRRRVALFLVRRHLAAVGRCLELVAHDRHGVLASLVAGRLRRLEPLDADPHHGGQRSVALRFAEGPALIFKPRDVRADAFIVGDAASAPLGAATLLNADLARTLRERLPTHAIISAGPAHGYAERLADARRPLSGGRTLRFAGALAGAVPALRGHALRSTREANAFWRAAGALASHLAAFGVGDQHAENLVLGVSVADAVARLHAVDCEIAFEDGAGIGTTQLVPSRSRPNPEPADGPHTHYGLDARRWDLCGFGASLWALVVDGRGRLVPVESPGSVQRRPTSAIVIAPDGSSGYGAHLGAVLRGAAEHWLALRANLDTLEERLRSELEGVRVRVLRKSTAEYVLAVTQRELGGPLWTGALTPPLVPAAHPFEGAELAQLDLLDVPAFDRTLGREAVEWVARPPNGRIHVDAPYPSHLVRQWWRIPRRAARSDALARAVGELVAFATPAGAFSRQDAENGVHIVRVAAGEPVQVALAMPRGVAQFRLEHDGSVTHWGLPKD